MKRFLLLLTVCTVLVNGLALAAEKSDVRGSKPPRQPAKSPKVDMDKVMAAELERVALSGTLKDVLARYGRLIGVPVFADWGALTVAGVKPTTAVSLRLDKARAEQVLEALLVRVAKKGKPLAWYPVKSVIVVTTQAKAMGRPKGAGHRPEPRPPRPLMKGGADFVFRNIPLSEAIQTFRGRAGVNFYVNWRSLEAVGISKDTPVSMKIRGASIRRALDLLTDQLSEGRDKLESIYWTVDRGVVTIATGHTFNTKTRIIVYDVADLMLVVPNFKGPRMRLSSRREDEGDDEGLFGDEDLDDDLATTETSAGELRKQTQETLIQIIKESIGEDMWLPQGKGSIRFLRNQMVISQTLLGFKLMSKAGALR